MFAYWTMVQVSEVTRAGHFVQLAHREAGRKILARHSRLISQFTWAATIEQFAKRKAAMTELALAIVGAAVQLAS